MEPAGHVLLAGGLHPREGVVVDELAAEHGLEESGGMLDRAAGGGLRILLGLEMDCEGVGIACGDGPQVLVSTEEGQESLAGGPHREAGSFLHVGASIPVAVEE